MPSGCHVCDRASSKTCAVHTEDCECWWLFGCCSSVSEYWLHKPGVLGSIPGGCRPFYFPLFSYHLFILLTVPSFPSLPFSHLPLCVAPPPPATSPSHISTFPSSPSSPQHSIYLVSVQSCNTDSSMVAPELEHV